MKKVYISLTVFLIFSFPVLYSQVSRSDLREIDNIVQEAFDIFKPTGLAIAVVKDSSVIYHKALGICDSDEGRPVSTRSLFNIASCTKAFTALSIGILVEEGRLDWDDKVTDYLPGFRMSDDYITRELTIEDLLCHRSGLETFAGDLLWYNTGYDDEEVMKRLRYETITNRFGVEFGYQNIMFMIAGDIISTITGMSWGEFVDSRIFDVLGMTDTRPSNDELEEDQDIALGHLNDKTLAVYDFNAAKPAAAIYSSVDELSLWTSLLMNQGTLHGRQVISPATIDKLFEPHTIIGTSAFQRRHGIKQYTYGLGWFMYDYHGEKIVEHDGGMPGYISKVTLIPGKKIAVIILNNGNESYINSAIRGELLDVMTERERYNWIKEYSDIRERAEQDEIQRNRLRMESRVPGTEPSHSVEKYTGLYRDIRYGDSRISYEDGKLKLALLPSEKVFSGYLEHWHYDTFKVEFKDEFLTFGLITFSFDSAGNILGYKIDLPSNDFHFYKLDFRKVSSSR